MLEHVEAHGLGQGPALPDGDDVTLLDVLPAGSAVHRHVLVALLEPLVCMIGKVTRGARSADATNHKEQTKKNTPIAQRVFEETNTTDTNDTGGKGRGGE